MLRLFQEKKSPESCSSRTPQSIHSPRVALLALQDSPPPDSPSPTPHIVKTFTPHLPSTTPIAPVVPVSPIRRGHSVRRELSLPKSIPLHPAFGWADQILPEHRLPDLIDIDGFGAALPIYSPA